MLTPLRVALGGSAATSGVVSRNPTPRFGRRLRSSRRIRARLAESACAPGRPDWTSETLSVRGPGSIYIYGPHHAVPGGTTAEGDAGLIEVASSSPFYTRGLAPGVVEYGIGSHKNTVVNEHYVISGTHYNPEHESQTQFMVCMGGVPGSGASEEERCGMTEGFEPEASYKKGPVVHNLERVNLCDTSNPSALGNGASGSPVYKGHNALGIYVASSEKDGCTVVYEGINRIEYDLHVHILKG